MKTYKFHDYLIQQFQDWYKWGDDNWPDAESKWYSELQDDELLEYFQSYMEKMGWECAPSNTWVTVKEIRSLM